jgi:hypothetical protein
MIFKLEADGVHFYCTSPEVTRKLIERGARIVGQSSAKDLCRALQSTKSEDRPRFADPQIARS